MRPTKFGSTDIPQGNGTMNNPVPFRSSLVPLRGGSFDMDGVNSYEETKVLNYSAWVLKSDATMSTTIDDVIDDLLTEASRGLRILRVTMRDGDERTTNAKLVQCTEVEDSSIYFNDADGTGYAQLDLAWEIPYPRWSPLADGVWFLDDGNFLDSGLIIGEGNNDTATINSTTTDFTVTNDGGATVYSGRVFIDVASGGSVTDVRIDNLTTEQYVEWTGTLASEERLEINLSTLNIEAAGVDAWDETTIPNTQTNFWELVLGANQFRVTVTSVTGSAELTYFWEREYIR